MLQFLRQRKRLRKLKKVKAGDGHLLKPYRIWHVFTHSLFHIKITNAKEGKSTNYALKSGYFVEEPRVDLYREKIHIAYAKLPAALPVEEGVIEINKGSSGINGIRFITDKEAVFSVHPDKRSIRGFRMWVHKRFPRISGFIGLTAIIILLASLAVGLPQFVETLTKIPWISEQVGTFESPIQLSVWTNIAIGVVVAIAGTERALMLRKHWLIDMETGHWDAES
ncbi:hypothetical protein [Paenibacillus sp. 1P07SE]|uniref:hypothetical protein n=1 Tax=Paenibacillus sp. 1P07SE TaxID=3132209 RepID=UPI0039A4EA0E